MSINIRRFLLAICCLFIFNAKGKTQSKKSCEFDRYHNHLMQKDATYRKQQLDFEQYYRKNIKGKQSSQPATYQLPIVVHVFLNDQSLLSDEEIYCAIDLTNEQMRAVNNGLDTDVELLFSRVDENGECFNGIDRITTPTGRVWLTSLCGDIPDDSWSDASVLNGLNWNSNEYFNIWIVQGSCPGGAGVSPAVGAGNGIMVVYNYFGYGNSDEPNSANNFGMVIPHETGHYLSLSHTFRGCHVPEDCLIAGDFVCDTPATTQPWPGDLQDCSDVSSECEGETGNVPKENYMGYKAYCVETFSPGQIARMHLNLEFQKANLWSPSNLDYLQVFPEALTVISQTITNNTSCIAPYNGAIDVTIDESTDNAVLWEWYLEGNCDLLSNDENTLSGLAAGVYRLEVSYENDCRKYIETFEVIDEICPGDFNGNGSVTSTDLTLFLIRFGTECDCCEDLDGSGQVTSADLTMFLTLFGTQCDQNEGVQSPNNKALDLLQLYPNPTKNELNIKTELTKYFEHLSFEIINIQGRIVKTGGLNNQNNLLNVADLPIGYYRLNLLNQQKNILITEPFLKIGQTEINKIQFGQY